MTRIRIRRLAIASVILGAAAALCAGCACTDIGCGPSLSLAVAMPPAGLPAGAYRFLITADGRTATCDMALPSDCTTTVPCTGAFFVMVASQCSSDGQRGVGPSRLMVETTAAAVEVRTFRDGNEVSARSFAPVYTTWRPNGNGCAPACQSARASLDLSNVGP
jgi:hypothetical protein